MNKHLVFVYGTLRRGGVRAMPDIFPGSKFIGRASARGGLYDMGEYPGLLLDESGPPVVGEVYEVDDETLSELDVIESSAYYLRRRVEASVGERRMTCWVYVYDPEFYPRPVLIASGDWIEYDRARTGRPGDERPGEAQS